MVQPPGPWPARRRTLSRCARCTSSTSKHHRCRRWLLYSCCAAARLKSWWTGKERGRQLSFKPADKLPSPTGAAGDG